MKILLTCALTCYCILVAAQPADTVHVKATEILILGDSVFAPDRDTTFYIRPGKYKVKNNPYKSSRKFYEKLKTKSHQNKVTGSLFDLLYVNPQSTSPGTPEKNSRSSHEAFEAYEGMVISHIRILPVDVLEGSVSDTTKAASSGLARIANTLHMQTWKRVIRSALLLEEGEPIDPYLLADTERILRRLPYIQDAKVYVKNTTRGTEIVIAVQDRIAWGSRADIDGLSDFKLTLTNRNIGGSGKFASAAWVYNTDYQPNHGYDFRVGAQNIQNTITSWSINHTKIGNHLEWGGTVQKEFVAPEIKFGGGLDIRQISDSTVQLDGEAVHNGNFTLNYQDLWLGRSFQLPSKYERKNLVIAGRLLHRQFAKQPFVSQDSNSLYYNRVLALGEVSISNQQYLKTNYINAIGISEDIPLGYRFSFITGRDFNEFFQQNYYGLHLFWAFYIKNFGYLLASQEVGAFDRDSLSNGAYATRINYFSPLFDLGRFHLRNFARLTYHQGIGQKNHRHITLRDKIRDVQSAETTGNNTFAFSFESVLFTPWYFYGFRFAPFAYYTLGEIWDSRLHDKSSTPFRGVGGGIRIRNEALAFSTIELRLTHYHRGNLEHPTVFSVNATVPVVFSEIFKYKPRMIPYN
ncbi:hypothetical protein [Marinoscillum furvescens]|nr:hypothetical protein [Marinoscillum furvescens]